MGEAGMKRAQEIKDRAQAELDASAARREAESATADMTYAAQQAAARPKPRWQTPRFWLGILSMLAGVGISIAAGAGADPADLEAARAVAEGAGAAAEQLVAADEAGDWTQGLGGAALAAGGLVAVLGKRRRK